MILGTSSNTQYSKSYLRLFILTLMNLLELDVLSSMMKMLMSFLRIFPKNMLRLFHWKQVWKTSNNKSLWSWSWWKICQLNVKFVKLTLQISFSTVLIILLTKWVSGSIWSSNTSAAAVFWLVAPTNPIKHMGQSFYYKISKSFSSSRPKCYGD